MSWDNRSGESSEGRGSLVVSGLCSAVGPRSGKKTREGLGCAPLPSAVALASRTEMFSRFKIQRNPVESYRLRLIASTLYNKHSSESSFAPYP